MLILTFQAGNEAFGVDTRHVIEVTPWVELRPIPHAPAHVVGLCHYRGTVVPVVDVARLLGGAGSEPRLNTRIILAKRPAGNQGLLGLLTERVRDVKRVSESDLLPAPLAVAGAPYLGPLVQTDNGLVQLLVIEQILPESLRLPAASELLVPQ